MNLNETRLSGKTIYGGRILTLQVDTVCLPDGQTALREVVRHSGGVCIAALTDDRQLLFVRQFRYPYGRVLAELPAGKLNKGEDPFGCARRELQEETGACGTLEKVGELYPSVGYTDEVLHLFIATDLTFGAQNPDEDEFLEVERVPLATAIKWVEEGKLPDAKTQALVLHLARRFGL